MYVCVCVCACACVLRMLCKSAVISMCSAVCTCCIINVQRVCGRVTQEGDKRGIRTGPLQFSSSAALM